MFRKLRKRVLMLHHESTKPMVCGVQQLHLCRQGKLGPDDAFYKDKAYQGLHFPSHRTKNYRVDKVQ